MNIRQQIAIRQINRFAALGMSLENPAFVSAYYPLKGLAVEELGKYLSGKAREILFPSHSQVEKPVSIETKSSAEEPVSIETKSSVEEPVSIETKSSVETKSRSRVVKEKVGD